MTTFIRAEAYTVSCPNDDGGTVVKIGKRDGKQRYRCKKCLKDFREPNVYSEGNKYTTQQMGLALQSYFDGLSYREVARNIARAFNIEAPDESTIYRWVQEFSQAAFKAMSQLKPYVGDRWVADELQLKVEGRRYWLWSVMDAKTRYILGIHLTPKRSKEAAGVVIRKAVEAAGKHPQFFVSDQLGSYIQPSKLLMPRTKHIAVAGLDAKINNNLSERLQGTFRDRTKVARGFKSQETGQAFLEGWVADYNLCRPHMSLGDRTPAEAAGVITPFKNWREVVERLDYGPTPSRPDWHFREPTMAEIMESKETPGSRGRRIGKVPPSSTEPILGEMLQDKQFEKMDIPTALEAIYPLWEKKFKSSKPKKERFRTRRGF